MAGYGINQQGVENLQKLASDLSVWKQGRS